MNGTIDASGVYELGNLGAAFRTTAYLTSSDPDRKIEISINGGQDYTLAQYDVDGDGVIGVAIVAPITGIRFTGAEGDAWGVLL